MKTLPNLIYALVILLLVRCNTNPVVNKGLEIIGYRYKNEAKMEEQIFRLSKEDIICVDWKNQSYKLNDSAIAKIKNSKFTGGYINEFIKITYNDTLITTVNIMNSFSSNHKYFKNSPFTCVYGSTNNIFTADNWFVINMNLGKTGGCYKNLFRNDLFSYLQKSNLLTASNWECDKQNPNDLVNVMNPNFDIDFCKKFHKENIVSSSLNFLCHSAQCKAFVDSLENLAR